MKPAPFEYDVPESLEEALALLTQYGEDARVLAGGQSLVPMMNFRLVRPVRIIDLNGLIELAYVRELPNGVAVGAMARQRWLERSSQVRAKCPLLAEALPWVGHIQIRNRGTIGGSLSHADPAAELPVVVRALDAKMRIASASGERWVAARDFFVGYFTTAVQPHELLMEIEFPHLDRRTGTAFTEYARRHGDFALGGAAAVITLDDDGLCQRARIALLGVGSIPQRASEAEAVLSGRRIDDDALKDASALVQASIEPVADVHGGSDYRRRLIAQMARKAISDAAANATGAA